MEETHRIHKDVAWGWFGLALKMARSGRARLSAVLPPRDRVTTPWSLRAPRDWTA